MTELIKYNAARNALQQAVTLDDVAKINDEASILEAYAKQIKDADMECWVAEIKLRAKIRIGEISEKIEKKQGERNDIVTLCDAAQSKSKSKILQDAGLTRKEASRCENLAQKKDECEEAIAEAKENNKPVTYADVEKKIKSDKKSSDLAAKKVEIIADESREIIDNKPLIFHKSCDEFLDEIDDESVDLLLTDPPYSTDVENIEEFVGEWLLKALSKVKKTGRAYVCIGAYPDEILSYLSELKKQTKFIVDNPLIWTYRNTLGVTPKNKYNLNYQMILHLYSSESFELDTSITNEMFSVQEINAPDGRLGDRHHTWQKPLSLAMQLIRHSTKEGDLIIDPFACTGTFGIASSKLNRNSIGCDISKENLLIAQERGCSVKFK